MSPRTPDRVVALAVLLVLWLVPLAARAEGAASGELGRVTLSASPLYAYVVLDGNEEPSGGGAAVTASYGLTSAIALQITGLWTTHDMEATEEGDGGQLQMMSLALGGAYALDMLAFTPMIELGVSLLHRRLNDAAATDLGLLAGLSAHYWLLEWFSIGLRIRYHAFLTDLRRFPIYVDMGPSLAIRW